MEIAAPIAEQTISDATLQQGYPEISMPDETSFVTAGIDAQTVSQDVSVMAENQAPVADLRVTVLNPDSMVNGNFTTETQIAWLWSYNGENFTYDPDGDAITNMSIGGISNSDLVGTLTGNIGFVTQFQTAAQYQLTFQVQDARGAWSNVAKYTFAIEPADGNTRPVCQIGITSNNLVPGQLMMISWADSYDNDAGDTLTSVGSKIIADDGTVTTLNDHLVQNDGTIVLQGYSGMAYGKIAAALNEKGILSPRWYWELHYGKKGSCKYSKLWAYATVKNILNDTVYLGIVTQNRTGSRSYKDKTMIQKPETEWIYHEDAHKAIVDRELWEAVQEKNRAVKQQVANHAAPLPALFTGKLVCADCGHPLVATRETQRRKNGTSKRYVSYICSRFTTTGHSTCSWHRIYEISLTTLVLNEIKAHSEMVKQDEAAVLDKLKRQLLSESAAKQEDSKLEISRLRRRIGELEHMTAKLYEDTINLQ